MSYAIRVTVTTAKSNPPGLDKTFEAVGIEHGTISEELREARGRLAHYAGMAGLANDLSFEIVDEEGHTWIDAHGYEAVPVEVYMVFRRKDVVDPSSVTLCRGTAEHAERVYRQFGVAMDMASEELHSGVSLIARKGDETCTWPEPFAF